MSERIAVRGIAAQGYHGVLPAERAQGQPFVVDLVVGADLHDAVARDDLGATVDYADMAREVVALVAGEPVDLIETLAARIADALLHRPRVEWAEVTVHKPEAPVGVPFGDVAVTVRRERAEPVVVALGGNLGDRVVALSRAVAAVSALDGVTVDAVSALYETEPVGPVSQPAYLNAVLTARTRLTPATLLLRLREVEQRAGRVRDVRWGPRTIDLDLVQYGEPAAGSDVRCDTPYLTLPHPRAAERAFVLVPWLDADPAARLRVGDTVRSVAELVEEIGRAGVRPGPGWAERPRC